MKPSAILFCVGGALGLASPAVAADDPPAPFTLIVRDTADIWRNTQGGLRVGDTVLNKFQLAGTFDGEAVGRTGFKAHFQYFHTSGMPLSGKLVGDIQAVSNIEALNTDRLFEAWVEQSWGDRGALRIGLMDLNSDFDSIAPAGLFIDSSHGIGPDLSKSGLNGPSIFPVSSLGVHGVWSPSKSLTLRAAAFDGVPGDPAHPKALAAVKLGGADGALLITQADLKLAGGAQASLGIWGYTASFDRLDRPGLRQRGQGGAYAYLQGPLPVGAGWTGWVRAGLADPNIQVVSSYLGAGVVKTGPLPGRKDDELGFAISHAAIGGPARRADDLPDAETTFEATYRYQVSSNFALQPDVQYVIQPASQAGLRNALVIGVRLSFAMTSPAPQ